MALEIGSNSKRAVGVSDRQVEVVRKESYCDCADLWNEPMLCFRLLCFLDLSERYSVLDTLFLRFVARADT